MDFDEFKSTLMDLVSKEVEDRGLEDISLKLTTVDSPDGMTERLMVSVGESKMSMAFRLKEIYRDVENGEDIDHNRYWYMYPVFFIMANTGLRAGELTGLRWEDVNLQDGYISVNRNLLYFNHRDGKGCYYSISTPKTVNSVRKVIITQAVIEAFILERRFQDFLGLKNKDVIDGYSNFIFVNQDGHVQSHRFLNKAIHKIVNDYNDVVKLDEVYDPDDLLPHFSCHILRHTYATRLLEAGVSIKFIQAQMGHSEIQTTMDTYIDPTDDFKRIQIKPFEKYMNSALEPLGDNTPSMIDDIS